MRSVVKKWLWHFLLAGVCLIIACAALFQSARNGLRAVAWGLPWAKKPENLVKLGIYDPSGSFDGSTAFAIDHFFLDWNSYDSEELRAGISKAVSRRRWPMLTVEPWPSDRSAEKTTTLFADIQAGRYDDAISRLCRDINSVGSPLFIRWGHEMENITGRYPWAQTDIVGYVRAYRHFVDRCRALLTPECYFVWSPVGHKELFRYWPGPDYVDYIGVSIFGFPEYDLRNYGRIRSFDTIFSEVYQRVVLFDKPVMIAELGVTGDESYQRDWIHQAFRSFRKYPKLQVAVYFSAQDGPLAWGTEYSVPNWKISPAVFEAE
jgi:endoglucanase